MPGSNDEKCIENVYNKFLEYEQKTMSGGANTVVDEELLKSFIEKCQRLVEDALEQNTLSIQTAKVFSDYFFDLLERDDPLSIQIMRIFLVKYSKGTL